jgi:PAS domain S-box-containing protein
MRGLAARWTHLNPSLYVTAGIVWTLVSAAVIGRQFGDEPRLLLLTGVTSAMIFVAVTALVMRQQARLTRERAELEQAAAEARRLLQEVINASAAPIYAFDRSGRAVFLNAAAAAVIGRPAAALVGRTRKSMHPPECAAIHDEFDRQVIESGKPLSVEERSQGEDGERFFLSMKFPLRAADGTIYAVGGVSTEITELRRAQEAANRANATLEQTVLERTHELMTARDRAQQADRAKTSFLSAVSHELRTPLNSIIGFTDVVVQGLAGPLNQEQHHQLSIVQESAHMLLALINEILDISRIEAGKLQLVAQEFDLADLLHRKAEALASAAAAKGLALVTRAEHGIHMTSDPRRVAQIVTNLVSNAVKFTDSGTVTLEARAEHGRVLVVVRDTGPGISAQDLTQLFRPFAQVGIDGKKYREGTGLGLVISQYLARALGGEITVQSSPGQGSSFVLALPPDLPGAADSGSPGLAPEPASPGS